MLRKKKKFISKVLLVSMCASIVPATVALAEENTATQENVSNGLTPTPTTSQLRGTASISLKSNATTGYSWTYSIVQGDSIVQTLKGYRSDDTSGTIDGSGGTDFWQFKSVKEGSTTLRFQYSRSGENTVAETREFIVTVDNTMNITVKETGKTAQIKLESNPSTGYQWSYIGMQKSVLVEDSKIYVTAAEQEGKIGSGGTDIWIFRGLQEGPVILEFKYRYPWTGPAIKTKFFKLTVDKELNVDVTYLGEPTSQTFNDINGDGKVNLIDFALLKKYLLDNTVVINKDLADRNCDGKINAIDAALLKKALLA